MHIIRRVGLDELTNVAILVTCVLLSGAVVQRYFVSNRQATSVSYKKIKIGDQAAALPGVSYADATSNLVLYLKSTCPYCTKSMDFYRSLRKAAETRRGGSIRMIVAGVETRDALQRYLDEHQLHVDEIVSVPDSRQPTPNLLLVDKQGVVTDTWLGLQAREGEQRLLTRVASAP